MSQGRHTNEIFRRFPMERSNPMKTPLEVNWRKENLTSREVVEDSIYR